jgi:cellulose synthase/poly-beta-1,6-N-acetylglucosamine synthase-like glycosyltransferase
LDAARFALQRERPWDSAARTFTWGQLAWLVLLFAGLIAAAVAAPKTTASIAHALAFGAFACAIVLRLFAAASALAPRAAPAPAPIPDADLPLYTVIAPLYREAAVAEGLLRALERLDYPADRLEILLVVEEDDPETRAAVASARPAENVRVIVCPPAAPRTKPKALNLALHAARGAFVVVYDAEDRPDPAQLRAALAAFAEGGPGLVCVQAPLQVDNAEASWIAGQFAAEYAIQFQAIVPLLARLGLPFPLGGTSNHFRTDALRAAGGWDPFNVTEDADIGFRLAREGGRLGAIAPPTHEEAPARFGVWLRQRTRWIKGHIQTWLVLMRRPFRAYRDLGAAGFWTVHLVLLGGIAAALVHGPLALALLAAAVLPAFQIGAANIALALFGYATAGYGALVAAAALRDPRLARAALTMPFYWPLASIAGVLAVIELIARPHYWAKTSHGLTPRPALGWGQPPK